MAEGVQPDDDDVGPFGEAFANFASTSDEEEDTDPRDDRKPSPVPNDSNKATKSKKEKKEDSIEDSDDDDCEGGFLSFDQGVPTPPAAAPGASKSERTKRNWEAG